MKQSHWIFLLVSAALLISIPVIRIVQAQFAGPSISEITGMSHSLRVYYWANVLSDPSLEEFHARALEQLELPARLTGNIGVMEDCAKVGLQSGNPEIITRAYLLLGDVLLEQGNWEEAKNKYRLALLSGSPKASRHYAQRLWDIGEREESIRQSLLAVENDALRLEDCVGEDSLLRRIVLTDALSEEIENQTALAPILFDYGSKIKNAVRADSDLIRQTADPFVQTALQMKSLFAAGDERAAFVEWDRLVQQTQDYEGALQAAALLCAELQFDDAWRPSVDLAEHVLNAQDRGLVKESRRDEFLYRKALGLSRLNEAQASIAAAKEGMEVGYPDSSYGQRAAVLYCQRALFASPHYPEAKEILTTVINFALSEEAFYDAQYALPICEFGLRNFQESSRLVDENLARLNPNQTRWKQQLYRERFLNSRSFMDQFEARQMAAEKRRAARANQNQTQEAGQ
ncbi:MAG: hypothetical protein JXR73_17110 [Candidatus Omnitrophica bacterium]|nr:hypothetical protein [Candidatus Omnitrophota bacterium]